MSETLVPLTWLWISIVTSLLVMLGISSLLIRQTGLASQWQDQFLSARDLAQKRRNVIEAQKARLTKAMAAIQEIGLVVHGTALELQIKDICKKAARIPSDEEIPQAAKD